jgi:hypothetical protein
MPSAKVVSTYRRHRRVPNRPQIGYSESRPAYPDVGYRSRICRYLLVMTRWNRLVAGPPILASRVAGHENGVMSKRTRRRPIGGGRTHSSRHGRTYLDAMDDDWTWHLGSYVAQLRDAHLIPPINGVEVGERNGRPVLRIDIPIPISEDLSARIEAVLASVPHQIRHVPFSDDGRRPGVGYA